MKSKKEKYNNGTYYYYYINDKTGWIIFHGLLNRYNSTYNKRIGYIYKHQRKGVLVKKKKSIKKTYNNWFYHYNNESIFKNHGLRNQYHIKPYMTDFKIIGYRYKDKLKGFTLMNQKM